MALSAHTTASIRGDEHRVVITVKGSEADLVSLLDSLSTGTGPSQVLAVSVASTVGLVDVGPATERANIARMLTYYGARLAELEAHQ